MQTALITGDSRPKSAPLLRLPAFPIGHYPAIPAKYHEKTFDSSGLLHEQVFNFSTIECFSMGGSVMCIKDSALVAWIHQGYAGSRNNTGRCQFYDVAFPTLTFDPQNRITGVMLDSTCFDSLESAVQFIENTFAGQAVQS